MQDRLDSKDLGLLLLLMFLSRNHMFLVDTNRRRRAPEFLLSEHFLILPLFHLNFLHVDELLHVLLDLFFLGFPLFDGIQLVEIFLQLVQLLRFLFFPQVLI
mmetsp:Transcript_2775/g.2606  ORF Transcript_2775/g.2606 Transcript_2775/m.2606 type:complete len:102 (-) Transcript_2775:601-906(-)